MELSIICFTKRGLETAMMVESGILSALQNPDSVGSSTKLQPGASMSIYPTARYGIENISSCRVYVKGAAEEAAEKDKAFFGYGYEAMGIENPDEDKNSPWEPVCVNTDIRVWAGEQMRKKNALLFIGAVGIAVRAIAPHIENKLSDSPVIVMDEVGVFCVPILSGHMGGANELAIFIAEIKGATPVITTATDINGCFAVDVFARENNLFITDKDAIKKISAKVLSGERLTMSVESGHIFNEEGIFSEAADGARKERIPDKIPDEIILEKYPPKGYVDVLVTSEDAGYDAGIILKPRRYILGAGCRRGLLPEVFEEKVLKELEKLGVSVNELASLATVDLKSDEEAFLCFCKKHRLELRCFSPEKLMQAEGDFSHSDFVLKTTGADNVCERAAACATAEAEKRMRLRLAAFAGENPSEKRHAASVETNTDEKKQAAFAQENPNETHAYEFVLRKTGGDKMTLAVCKTGWMVGVGVLE